MTRNHSTSAYLRWLATLAAVAFLAGPAYAGIDLRVESRPMASPIEVFVRVTDDSGTVAGLSADDFSLMIDGQTVNTFVLGQPRSADPSQGVSVVLVQGLMTLGVRDAASAFISQMAIGDTVSIIKFRRRLIPEGSAYLPVVQPLTPIDHGTGTITLIDFLPTDPTFNPGLDFVTRRELFSTLSLAMDQFAMPPFALPKGPRAIVLVDLGSRIGSTSESQFIALANANSVPVFTIHPDPNPADPAAAARMAKLAEDTGANSFAVSSEAHIAEAYETIAALLSDAYPLAIPQSVVTDCNPHMLEVTVHGEREIMEFSRCDTTPEPFQFDWPNDVSPGATVVSESVTITGIDGPVAVTVMGGEYSIGCGQTFTSAPGTILPEEAICVRHTAPTTFETSSEPTVLIIGGVSARFFSTTSAAPSLPPDVDGGNGGGGASGAGGGGATGLLELLLGLGALLTRRFTRPQPFVLFAISVFIATPAGADIALRVESRPNTDPIEAFVRIADGSGAVTGLTAADFAVTLDGAPLDTFAFGLPPDQDPAQRKSVIFVLNNGFFASAIQGAVRDFVNQMAIGDYAAVVKTRYSIDPDLNIQLVQPFTMIDGGTGTNSLNDFVTVESRAGFPRSLASLMLAVEQFAAPPAVLPNGPKAIILVGTGRVDLSPQSMSDVVAAVTDIGMPVFTIEVGDNTVAPEATARMASLAADTGGTHFAAPDAASIAEAHASVASLLNSAYRLSIPAAAVTDCNLHMLEATAEGQSASTAFTRCDSTPENFHFPDRPGVPPGEVVVSDTVTITGIESPVAIAVTGGEYSIGCGSTFTSAAAFILPEDEVCVRHMASTNPNTSTQSLLVAGGVSSPFWSSTGAAPPPPPDDGGGNGGGGASGLLELSLALGVLLARRSRS